MTRPARPFPLLIRVTLYSAPLLLSACATQALDSAPPAPDRPWQPNIAANGEILPGRHDPHALNLPAGYTLPSNTQIRVRPPAPEVAVQNGHAYSLAELIDIAQSANPETRRAWNLARDSALAIGNARSAYLPRLTATVVGGYNHSRNDGANPTISNVGAAEGIVNSGLSGLENALGGVRNNNSGAGEVQTLGMEWLLFDFGKREAVIETTKQAQIASNVLFTATHQKIIYGVTTAYYTHAAAAARVRLLRQARDNARFVEAAAEARLHQGQGTIVDVTQARQATAQTELRLVQAEGDEENTRLELLNAIGISPATKLETLDISGRPLALDDMRLTDAFVQQAVSRRPDVLAAYASAKAAKSRVQAARSEFLPKIFMTGNVAYTTGRLALSSIPGVGSEAPPTLNLSSNAFSSLILGGITVPIFDGGTRAALLKQAQDQSDSADATLRQTVDSSVKQIVAAENALRTSLSAYAASGRLETAARTSFEASSAAYRSGVGSLTQTSIAQNGYLDATLSHSDAYYAALIAAAGLAFGTGSLSRE
ncbi:protein CyaE [Gluconobacter oxydans]|uniref:Protein CyaE n=1 Tax=Gluconobacter oxydans TaxID=442 RepID=A0AB35AN86_GLUOY|nr:TolC family protein [Gluconobacter oxydans]KXV31330.1 transporter [Gluconobacter oxydans]MBF0856408.1 TolC family protein [Gluconobacter oxydans]TCW26055.1 outer membrane protein TolC [Gluconobacter oxydans]GEC61313.1 protein CyaE [Gluconobacter oxydans]